MRKYGVFSMFFATVDIVSFILQLLLFSTFIHLPSSCFATWHIYIRIGVTAKIASGTIAIAWKFIHNMRLAFEITMFVCVCFVEKRIITHAQHNTRTWRIIHWSILLLFFFTHRLGVALLVWAAACGICTYSIATDTGKLYDFTFSRCMHCTC